MILRNGKMVSAKEKNLYLEIKELNKKSRTRKRIKLRIRSRNRKLNI
jgi:hypothetical protein